MCGALLRGSLQDRGRPVCLEGAGLVHILQSNACSYVIALVTV
jgi:hypothetical protein